MLIGRRTCSFLIATVIDFYFHVSSQCVSASSAKKKKKAKKVSDEEVGVSGVKSADVSSILK